MSTKNSDMDILRDFSMNNFDCDLIEKSKKKSRLSNRERKSKQLAKQIFNIVSTTLNSVGDERLDEIELISCEAVAGSSNFMLIFSYLRANPKSNYEDTLKALKSSKNYFRAEISKSINRKKTPEISFVLLHPGEEALL